MENVFFSGVNFCYSRYYLSIPNFGGDLTVHTQLPLFSDTHFLDIDWISALPYTLVTMLMTNDKTKLPILTHPSAPPLPYNWPRHACTPEQIAKLEELKGMVPDMLVKDEGRAEEEAWCDESCLLRYLRATKVR